MYDVPMQLGKEGSGKAFGGFQNLTLPLHSPYCACREPKDINFNVFDTTLGIGTQCTRIGRQSTPSPIKLLIQWLR